MAPAHLVPPGATGLVPSEAADTMSGLPGAVLRYQWTVSAIVIALLTVVSVIAGWWLAGRLLSPLRHITATAHRLSVSNLHERIALAGPRDELKDLADTFDAMLERLERSVDSQRRFIANAAHELRTPLSVQRAAIQIGLDDPLPDHLVPVREKLLTANRRTERLIDSLLLLAQAEHGPDGPGGPDGDEHAGGRPPCAWWEPAPAAAPAVSEPMRATNATAPMNDFLFLIPPTIAIMRLKGRERER